MTQRVRIFDTTLRDGEQTPGVSLQPSEKAEIARQLERLGVDTIEAGFPVTSDGDFEAVQEVSRTVKRATVAALARCVPEDIDRAHEAVREAVRPCIHVFIATSDVHMKYKLKREAKEVLAMAVAAVRHAKSCGCEVEFSAEDATRSRTEFLLTVLTEAARAGADVINVPDTVGYTTPEEFFDLIWTVKSHLSSQQLFPVLSVHCHDDLGLAVANSLAAVRAGADQIECTVNGLGERAGNTPLEEVVMALATRHAQYNVETGIETTLINPTSRIVSVLTGVRVQPNKAIVGQNAFAHQSGVHQDGMMKNRLTYEIMTPESVGIAASQLVLGKTSGRHAFRDRLAELGVQINDQELDRAFTRFKQVVDRKPMVSDRELLALVDHHRMSSAQWLVLDSYNVTSGNHTLPSATARVIVNGEPVTEASSGDGPIDAVFQAINRACRLSPRLADYSLQSLTGGQDALGEVRLVVEIEGQTCTGRGLSIDILEASARAYVDALNRLTPTAAGIMTAETGR